MEEPDGWRGRLARVFECFRSPVVASAVAAVLVVSAIAFFTWMGSGDTDSAPAIAGPDAPLSPASPVESDRVESDPAESIDVEPSELAAIGEPVGTGSGDFDPASELEAVEYLGQLMAVADPGDLSDEAIEDLLF